jgi:hypothetical protein
LKRYDKTERQQAKKKQEEQLRNNRLRRLSEKEMGWKLRRKRRGEDLYAI